MPWVDLDIAGDQTPTQVQEWADSLGCDLLIVQENGPGGGNPIYRFYGSRDALEDLIEDYCPDRVEQVLHRIRED